MLSYLFRTNYTFKDRYLFTGSLRIDGSSRFGASNRYGYFPSFAVGWNLKEEGFLRDNALFTALKLRASWGQIGNDKIGAYPGIPIVTGNLNAVFGTGQTLQYGASPIQLANPLVKWEKSTQTDIGADMVLFNGQLEATLDYYHRLTDGILVQVPIPNYIGVSTQPYVNAAKVLNTGGNSQILGGGLGNEVTFTTRTTVGQPIGCFWGLKVLGVFQTPAEIASSPNRNVAEQPGDLRFVDTNGDGTITDADKAFLGCPIPDASNREPRVTTAGNNYVASDRFIEDGSFLKLQNVQLGYRLPAQLTHGLSIEQARIYVSGTNLFNITNYTGYTPELPGGSVIASGIDAFGGIYPPARTFTLGIDVGF